MNILQNKKAIVTGASKGIGRAISLNLAKNGCDLFLISRTEQDLKKVKDEILQNYKVNVSYHILDITNFESVQEIFETIIIKANSIDILINNAGIAGARGRIDKVDVVEAKKIFDVNFFGVWHGCAVFSKKMIDQGTNAAIYNLGSENSLFIAVPKSVAYVASKHSVFALSESLRNDLPDFIHVGTIFPGYVDTPLTSQAEGGMNADEFAKIVKEQIKNEEHIIVSHAYNNVHIEKRNNEISLAYKKYAPRYDGDDEYDVKTILSKL